MPAEPVLALRALVAGYQPGITILNGMSADVVAGEVRVVLGPNGTGKSTMLKVAFGLLPPVSGEINLRGNRLQAVPPFRMGKLGVAYLPQKPSIFPFLSVEANLRLGAWTFRRDRRRASEKIERAYAQFPILRERRRQHAGTLSGGQQRQLEIARALMADPEVLLIDEPTASVEPRVSAQIYEMIASLARAGKAILLVDQNITGALGIADHVYVMRTGALFEHGERARFEGDVSTLVKRWLYTT